MLLGDITKALEESGRGMIITTLTLNRFNDDSSNRAVPVVDKLLNLLQAALLLGIVLGSILLQGVLESREGSLGPIEGRDVKLVNSLRTSSRQTSKATAVERVLEAENRKLRGARGSVVQTGVDLLVAPFGLATLAAAVKHERGLVSQLVGLRSGLGREDVVHALRSDLHQAVLEIIMPKRGGEVAYGWTVDQSRDHLGRIGGLDEGGVVVANRDGGDLRVAVGV